MASVPPPASPAVAGAAHEPAHVRVFARTDVGRTREHNEDAYLVADLADALPLAFEGAGAAPHAFVAGGGALFLVADGLGGAAAGEVASHLATHTAHEALRAALPAAAEDPTRFATALRDAVLAANAGIHRAARERAELRGMATTLTAAALLGPTLYLAQVGDSRAYLVREGAAHQLTKDQSLVQRLVDAGELTPEQAETSARRNIILQALGADATVKVDVTRQPLRRGDLLLLCSDGLSGQVRAAEIAEYAAAAADLDALCAALVDRANATGGPDNITVVAAHFDGEALAGPAEDDAVGRHTVTLPAPPDAHQTPAAGAAPAPYRPIVVDLAPSRGGGGAVIRGAADYVESEDDDTDDVVAVPAAAAPGAGPGAAPVEAEAAAGVSASELAERRGRVRLVYAALLVLAASVAAFYLYRLLTD